MILLLIFIAIFRSHKKSHFRKNFRIRTSSVLVASSVWDCSTSKINFRNIRMPHRHFSKSARFRIGGKNTGTHSLTHSVLPRLTPLSANRTTDLSRTNQSIKLFFGRLKTTISLREFLFCTCLPTKIGDNNTVILLVCQRSMERTYRRESKNTIRMQCAITTK